MIRALTLFLLAAFVVSFTGCASDPIDDKRDSEEQEHEVEFKAGLKRRSPILRPRGFAQYREFRRRSFAIPVAFFEADSVLRLSNSGKGAPSSPEDVFVLPCVGPRLAQLANEGFYIAIISNQPDIGKKTMTQEQVDKTMFATVQAIIKQGGVVDYFDYADKEDEYLKPDTGMGERLERFLEANLNPSYKVDRYRSFIVGKPGAKSADRQFAENFFGPSNPWQPHFFDGGTFFGWHRRMGVDAFGTVAEAKRFAAVQNACCDVTHNCPGDGKSNPKGYSPPQYQYPVND